MFDVLLWNSFTSFWHWTKKPPTNQPKKALKTQPKKRDMALAILLHKISRHASVTILQLVQLLCALMIGEMQGESQLMTEKVDKKKKNK